MIKRRLLTGCCVLWAVTCYAQTTAVRPAQIQPAANTADVTVAIDPTTGNFLGIGSVVAWRTDATSTPTFTSADNTKVVELTSAGTITSTLPATGGGFSDGSGFEIQVGAGTLTLSATSGYPINGKTSITVGPYQSVILSPRGSKWYAAVSVSTGAVGGPPITHVQQAASTGTSSGSSVTFPAFSAIGAGNSVVGTIVFHNSSNTVTGISLGSNTATLIDFSNYGGTAYSAISFTAVNVTGGPTTLTMTFSGTPGGTDHFLMLDEYSNVAAVDTHTFTDATSGSSNSATINPSVSTAMIWSGLSGWSVSTFPTGFIQRNNSTANNQFSAEKAPGATGSLTVTWTMTSSNPTYQELISLK